MNPELRKKGQPWCRLFPVVIVFALAIRAYLVRQYYCISSDGVQYIKAARDFYSGDIAGGLGSVYPPAYPTLIALVYPIVGDWELSGQIMSVICGVLLLFPLYALCNELYEHKVALLACFLAAISPYLARYAVHVRSESPFVLLTTTALLIFYRGIVQGVASRFFYGGLVAGFAYLVRPEAIGFLALVPIVLVLTWWNKRERNIMWVFKSSVLLIAGFLLFALPYVYYLSLMTGQWGSVTKKAGITLAVSLTESGLLTGADRETLGDLESLTLLQFVHRHPLLYAQKLSLDLPASIGVYLEAVYYSLVPFLLIGLFLVSREKLWLRKDFLLLLFLIFYLVGFALVYVNLRYSVQLVPISLGWIVLGMFWCWRSLGRVCSVRRFPVIVGMLIAIFLAGTLPKTLEPIAFEKAYIREAGRYVSALKGTERLRIFVSDSRIAFYGNAQPIFLSELDEAKLIEKIRDRDAVYLATDMKSWRERFPSIARDPARYGLIVDKEFPVPGKDPLVIFKIT